MDSRIISFAIEAHAKTNHLYDGKPYSVHLAMVAMIAQKYIDSIPDQAQSDVLAACWLHDTIEDCRLTYNDVRKIAGEKTADIVYALTNEKGKTRKDRANAAYYEGIRNTMWAKYVKICDRLANVLYSYENKSRMFNVYKAENEAFLKALFPNGGMDLIRPYGKIIKELNSLLSNEILDPFD